MNREHSKQIFVHYFRTVFKKSGLNWSPDCEVDISEAVDGIYDDAVYEAKRQIVDNHEELKLRLV